MIQENIPWEKLTPWQKYYLEHTLKMEKEFGRELPNSCFTKRVCFSILRKVGK